MNTKTIQLWHPIEGVWVHICQVFDDYSHKYFTDGVLVKETLNENSYQTGYIYNFKFGE